MSAEHAIPSLLIEASAGTGKTHALAKRLIELLKAGWKPQEIAALTFSRAAAGEIFERLVSLLAELSPNDPQALELLRSVIDTQHLSLIGTLDSFLMRIVRAFPHELGLSGEIKMLDDFQEKRERARISFSILRHTDEKLKQSFIEAFSLAMNHENVRSFTDAYKELIGKWHERVAALPDQSAWGDPKTIWKHDVAFAHVTEKELAHAADGVLATFGTKPDAKWTEFAEWVRMFRGKLSGTKGYVKTLLDAEDALHGDIIAFKFGRKEIVLTREQTLAVRDALFCVFGYVVRAKLNLAEGLYHLVSAFEQEYSRLVRKEGRLVFSDIPRLIKSLSEVQRLSLEYRMDAHLGAWALDEFQDTSREQWSALANLLDEAKQSNGTKPLFIVGDTKQAIYGWRNGDVNIFRQERDSGFYELSNRTETYRSGPAVVDAINRVFACGRIFDEFPAWKCPEHITAKPQLTGFVHVMDAPGTTKEDFVEPVFNALKANLGLEESDPRRNNISAAILVRNNSFGAMLADKLRMRGMKGVMWEGESAILDTPALAAFIDLVQLADHPGDKLTYNHFKLTPLAQAKYPDGIPPAAELSTEMASAFTAKGLVRTLRELRSCLPEDPAEAWSVFTEERFTEMLRAAGEFELSLEPDTKLADFKHYLEAKKRRTVAEDGKIKIITIHRSKGLGFDYVILPLYEYTSLTADSDNPLIGDNWILPDPTARVSRAVGGLEQAQALRKDRAEQEALCTYYVAMTRAKQAMTIICHPAGASLRFSDLVRSAEIGDANEASSLTEIHRETKDTKTVAVPVASVPLRGSRRHLKRRLPSLRFESGISAGSLFAVNNLREKARKHGLTAHAQIEAVKFSDALPRPEGFIELWRERAFELLDNGEWISGRIDRVVFFDNGEGLSAEIIDFKTSLANPERYEPQLAAYRRAVQLLTGIPSERISARLMKI